MQEYNENTVKAIINFYSNKGLNDYAISGILGNWYIESLFRPNNAQNVYMTKFGITDEQYTAQVDNGVWKRPDTGAPFSCDKIGYGLMQLTSDGRKAGFYNYVKAKGCSVANLLAQLEWCWTELTSKGYKTAFDLLINATSAGDAAIAFMKYYEKPASKDNPSAQKNRANVAEEFYDKYFGGTVMNKVLAISAGHYLYTAGKRCLKSIDPTETREWVLNSRIADKLTVILNRYDGIKIVRLDDPTGQKSIALETRCKNSDSVKADIQLCIHHNAGVKGGSGGGIVIYANNKPDRLAEAQKMYDLLIKYTGLKGNRKNPVKGNTSLYEIRVPKAMTLYVEDGFMDSTHDTPIILTESFADQSAQAMAEYFIAKWNLKLKDEGKSDILAEIESVKANINALEQRLKELEAML